MRERFPIKAAHAFVEPFADCILAFQSKQFAGRIVQISDAPVRIGHDDPFLDGVEDGLEETFLLREPQEIILHLLRPDAAESLDQFLKEPGFHRFIAT